ADFTNAREHVAGGSRSCAADLREILRPERPRPIAREIPESRGNDGADQPAARRNLDDGGKIRGLWFLQSARRDICGHFVPHGVSENASSGGISGGDVQRGRGILSRVGVRRRSEALGHRGTVAVGESFADGVHDRRWWRWKTRAARDRKSVV